jgi:hypothetical protein
MICTKMTLKSPRTCTRKAHSWKNGLEKNWTLNMLTTVSLRVTCHQLANFKIQAAGRHRQDYRITDGFRIFVYKHARQITWITQCRRTHLSSSPSPHKPSVIVVNPTLVQNLRPDQFFSCTLALTSLYPSCFNLQNNS